MTVSYVEREQADTATLAFYDAAEERFQALLNIFKVFGHTPELGNAFTVQIGVDANRVSKFGDALGVELEPMFEGVKPVLTISH